MGPVTTQDDFPAGFTTPPTTVDPNVRAALEFLGDQQARDPNFTVGAPFTPPPTPTTAPTTNPRQVDGPGTTQSRPVNVPALPRFPLINDLYNIYPNLPFATVERVVREEGGDLRTANDRLARGDY